MATETMEAPDAVEELKDYEYERLDATVEVRAFSKLIRDVERNPSLLAAEALCRGSRRLRYAIREASYDYEASASVVRQNRLKAVALLAKAQSLRSRVLATLPSANAPRIKRFFSNIAKRKDDLGLIAA